VIAKGHSKKVHEFLEDLEILTLATFHENMSVAPKRNGIPFAFVLLWTMSAAAGTLYVDLNSLNPAAPYSDWSTAATNIQVAIDAANPGDLILVTNGVYATGGKVKGGDLTNRAAVDKAVTVQSVNGPDVTIIQGTWNSNIVLSNGPTAVRCAWLTNGAALNGFTLRGGATRAVSPVLTMEMRGGGVWGNSTNASVSNCIIVTNLASYQGGGAYRVTLQNCILNGNRAVGSGVPGSGVANAGSYGAAASSVLDHCVISGNFADQTHGGGVGNCFLQNCALTENSCFLNGGAADASTLVNCTITRNTSSGYSSGYGAAVYGCNLINCIVMTNFVRTSYPNLNYASSALAYSCTDPLPPGSGNIAADPQLLADNVHLSASSPCRSAGLNSVTTGNDVDGQAWSNPPSMGCDEWHAEPVIVVPASFKIFPLRSLAFSVAAAGETSFTYRWIKDGSQVQDDSHYESSGTANLTVKNFEPEDAGVYQVVVSNAYGMATSQVVRVVIHAVSAAGSNPIAPFSSWATAATSIQEAIDAATNDEIVLVTNGVYASGGKVMAGDLTNRVALDKALTVQSVNGAASTVILGVRDAATNGPAAVRCAWLISGALLSGFTLQDGATRSTGDTTTLESGGGAWCSSTNATVSNCFITNCAAMFGGGIYSGTLNNSAVVFNFGITAGGGAHSAVLNNCTVLHNITCQPTPGGGGGSFGGGGTYGGRTRNSIVWNNYYVSGSFNFSYANFAFPIASSPFYTNCLTSPLPSTGANINADPLLISLFHISILSPCRAAGNSAFATGTDLDGEPWAGPPDIGCDQVIPSNLTGPLSLTLVVIGTSKTNWVVGHGLGFTGYVTGRASRVEWGFGDGPTITNAPYFTNHIWTAPGDYPVTFTAFNADNPAGVSTNILIHIDPIFQPVLEAVTLLSNALHFEFVGQPGPFYTVEATTNLAPPISWSFLGAVTTNGINFQVIDPINRPARFYRVHAQ
jgi:Immunoglobulin I-set domain/PKD domain